MRRWARDGGAGRAGEEGVERAEVRGAAVRAAGAGARPAQPPPQGTAHGSPGGHCGLGTPAAGHGPGAQTGHAGSGRGPSVWSGVTPWEVGLSPGDTERVLRATARLSTRSVWLSGGSPCQGLTVEGGDSKELQLLTLLQQLKVRMEGASCGHVRFTGGRRDR